MPMYVANAALLQFINQNYKELSINIINNTAIGQKDAQKGLFSLWKQVFHLPSSKRQESKWKIIALTKILYSIYKL